MSVETLWYTRCPVATAFSAAVRLGWIHEEFALDKINNSVSLLNFLVASRSRVAFLDIRNPNLFRHGGNPLPIWAFSQGNDVRLIALSSQDEFQPVPARLDSATPRGCGSRKYASCRFRAASMTRSISGAPPRRRGWISLRAQHRGFDGSATWNWLRRPF